jgi:hypothetical protein
LTVDLKAESNFPPKLGCKRNHSMNPLTPIEPRHKIVNLLFLFYFCFLAIPGVQNRQRTLRPNRRQRPKKKPKKKGGVVTIQATLNGEAVILIVKVTSSTLITFMAQWIVYTTRHHLDLQSLKR